MLRPPSRHLMIDKVLVYPVNTVMGDGGFPLRDDLAVEDEAVSFECTVYRASQSGVLSADERMAEMFRDQGSTNFTVMFGWPTDDVPPIFASVSTDPEIESPKQLLKWTHHGKDRRTFQFLELPKPVFLVSENAQLPPNGGDFSYLLSCRQWGL